MAGRKNIVASRRGHGICYEGGRTVSLIVKVTDGPNQFLDRVLHVKLSFDDIDSLAMVAAQGKNLLAASNARLAKMAAENNPDGE